MKIFKQIKSRIEIQINFENVGNLDLMEEAITSKLKELGLKIHSSRFDYGTKDVLRQNNSN